jgi:hypothetical protein
MKDLIFHLGTSNWGGTKKPPRAFTEQGIAMLSSVLRSPRAVRFNIEIMRAFVRLRQILRQNADLAREIDALEEKYDAQFKVVFEAIRQLRAPPVKPLQQIGFGRDGGRFPPAAPVRYTQGMLTVSLHAALRATQISSWPLRTWGMRECSTWNELTPPFP